MYTAQYVKDSLDKAQIRYDILNEKCLRVYYSNGDYTKLEVTEFGVLVAGKIRDFDELIN